MFFITFTKSRLFFTNSQFPSQYITHIPHKTLFNTDNWQFTFSAYKCKNIYFDGQKL